MMISRQIQKQLNSLFFRKKALIITGARQVGKTTMLKILIEQKGNVLWLNADEKNVRDRLSDQNTQNLTNIIGANKIVVIDEIQRVKDAGLLLKLMIDNFKDVQFIATGSSALEISDTIFEPITGRHFLFHLYPFALFELYPNLSPFELEQKLAFHLIYGLYPEVCIEQDIAEMLLKNLSDQYLYKDVLVWKDIRKPELLDKLLKLLAYQVGSEVSINELSNHLKVKSETVENYIDLLEKSFVIYKLNAFSNNPRKEVTKMSKIMFWDNGIRNAIIGNFNNINNRNDQGQLFENFIISERMKRNAWLNPSAKSYFWRNYNQAEVDFVEVNGEDISAYEIKWSTIKKHKVSRAFTNLYPNANTEIITPLSFYQFSGKGSIEYRQ